MKSCEEHKKCVPYYHCHNDGAETINIRSNLDREDTPCDSLRECCDVKNIREEVPEFEVNESCGFRNVDGLGFYAYNRDGEAQFGEFPWQMAILRDALGTRRLYLGSGSLIHPALVLTTAHNLNNSPLNELKVRGGEWNTQSDDEILIHEERDVQRISYHEKFIRRNLQNDVALLFLAVPFQIKPHINTICLPSPDVSSIGKNCIASGWGKNKFGLKGIYQVFLKKVELPVISNELCQNKLRKTRLGEDFELHDGFMCAGEI